jgi:hypothetical protein
MSIKIRCSCGQTLMARDEHAGKTVRCPACKQTLVVPAEPAAPAAGITEENWPPRDRDREEDRYRGGRREAARRRRDEYEEDYDDYDDRPRRRARPGPVDTKTIVLLSVGIAMLVGVIVATFPAVYSPSATATAKNERAKGQAESLNKANAEQKKKSDLPGFISTWRGVIILILSILIMGAAIASLVLLFTVDQRISRIFLIVTSAVGTGWGMLVTFWFIGYIFRGFVMFHTFDRPEIKLSISVWPAFALWLGLLCGGALIGVFCPLVMGRGAMWGGLGLGAGGLLGLVLMLADAQPWRNVWKELEEAGKKGKELPEVPWFFEEKSSKGGKLILGIWPKTEVPVANSRVRPDRRFPERLPAHFAEPWRVLRARCLSRNAKPTFIASRETSSLKPWPWPGKIRTS